MASILDLLRGTQKVLPVALDRIGDGKNSPIKQVRVQEFTSIKTVQVLATQQASGRFSKSDRPIAKSGFYSQQLRFVFKDKEEVGNRLPSTRDKAKLNCTCDAYYYYFWWWNKKVDAHSGNNYPKYKRKTPPPPEGYPEKNPQKIPGMCKHLAFLVRELRRAKVIK